MPTSNTTEISSNPVAPSGNASDQTAGQNPARRERKGPRGRVTIFGTWCKGCGLCVAFCPLGVLALNDEGHPIVIAPEKCTACHWCDTHCPDLAIVVNRIEA